MKLPKAYEPKLYEADIYSLWEKSGVFKPSQAGETYSIVMPPPNANANLHIGYELTAALEDIAARYHRAKGESVLLLPGADHAGFETQSVYEKQLAKAGKSRFDFSRDDLYAQIWDFVALNKDNFETQLRRMGVSCDWEHFTFTLDKKVIDRAYKTFKKMWNDGLIYRGERLVNFCTFHGTAFADIEVVYRQSQGHLWYLRYPLTDGSGEVIVATTRPETLLGDTAVTVNPNDKRYKNLIGKTVKLPLTNRELPILADDFVDVNFGTGAVKVTPAHDINDFEVGKRHDLPFLTVIDYEGKMTNVPDEYQGLTVDEARKKIVNDLKDQGYLTKVEDHTHNVGHCYKCGTVIQPLLREQWFINMESLADDAIKVLAQDKIKFYPESKKEQLITYLKGLHDWNISRQIAWGIPIPAFQNVDEPEDWIYDERVNEEIITVGDKTYHRDPDVFDTWFSSSSWPYATLDFPDSQDFKHFYPLGLMETGGEILYPWVSRMIMLGLYITGKVPFTAVYIHGYVMAEDGSKMSKSVGNVVDPLPVIDQFGSDALRMGIIWGRSPAVNRGYDERRVAEARNFCNKVWNIARYIENISEDLDNRGEVKPLTEADHWILNKLSECRINLLSNLDKYNFSEGYELLYHFIWDDFADWYIEASKTEPNKPLLSYLLESTLIMLHPFAPFVTETIWQTLDIEKDSTLALKTFNVILPFNKTKAQGFGEIQTLVSEIRAILKALKTKGVTLYHANEQLIENNAELIKQLSGISSIKQGSAEGLKLTNSQYDCWLDISKEVAGKYISELKNKQKKYKDLALQLEKRLANKAYIKNAPKSVVNQTKNQLAEFNAQLLAINNEINQFTKLN